MCNDGQKSPWDFPTSTSKFYTSDPAFKIEEVPSGLLNTGNYYGPPKRHLRLLVGS
jgi:hypothetical protein